jgi:hypothetical protein
MGRYGGNGKDITLIVAKKIITLTIVKVTEVRAQEVHAQEVRAKEVHAQEVRAKGVLATKETSMHVAVKEKTSIVSDSQIMATTIGATQRQHLPLDITTVINFIIQILHRTTTG